MSEHTPGPWVRVANSIKSRKADCIVVRLPAYTDCAGDETPEQLERWNADARLIAAAPELLEALEWYAELLHALDHYPWVVESTLTELRDDGGKRALKAIAKAKGHDNE